MTREQIEATADKVRAEVFANADLDASDRAVASLAVDLMAGALVNLARIAQALETLAAPAPTPREPD